MAIRAARSSAFAALLVLIGFRTLPAAENALTVVGKIVDETGAPVPEARVTASLANARAATTSDPAGAFRLELPAPGGYRVQAEREGFFLFTNANVTLDEGVPLEI